MRSVQHELLLISRRILPKNNAKAQRIIADTTTMLLFLFIAYISLVYRKLLIFSGFLLLFVAVASPVSASITYATRLDAVQWQFSGSKFSCELMHTIDDFGVAVFHREAGDSTRFVLESQSPRMKTGKAALFSKAPAWSGKKQAVTLASVNVREGIKPIHIKRKTSERMLAELQKGMELQFVRQPWYGDQQALKVVIPSIGFRKIHSDYLECLSGLLPVNFKQVERSALYYANDDSDLTEKVKSFLDKVVLYMKEDSSVKTIYLDGHTDSRGVRSENLIKSQKRTERVVDYLIERGVSQDMIVARWHGERYKVATNQNTRGRAKNRRVTLRLSKEMPHTVMNDVKKSVTPKQSLEQKQLQKSKQDSKQKPASETDSTKPNKA